VHIFWVAALLLAMIDLPDFGTSLRGPAGARLAHKFSERITDCAHFFDGVGARVLKEIRSGEKHADVQHGGIAQPIRGSKARA
jgi:hypothetical protein